MLNGPSYGLDVFAQDRRVYLPADTRTSRFTGRNYNSARTAELIKDFCQSWSRLVDHISV